MTTTARGREAETWVQVRCRAYLRAEQAAAHERAAAVRRPEG
jgi:hypothetical protein